MVSLKTLKILYISGSGFVGQGNNSLLARPELQKGVEVTVMLLVPDGRSDAITHAIPPRPECLPFISGIKRIDVMVFPGHGRCIFKFPGENGKVTVMARWSITNPNLDNLMLGSIQSFLPLSTEGVEEFYIQGYQAPEASYMSAMGGFESLPNLRSIHVLHCDTTVLLRALRHPTRHLTAPKLRTLRLYLDPQRTVSGEALMKLVKYRVSSGVRLEEFSILSQDLIVPVAEVMALKPHVGVVEYRMDDSIPKFEDH